MLNVAEQGGGSKKKNQNRLCCVRLDLGLEYFLRGWRREEGEAGEDNTVFVCVYYGERK